MKIFCCAYRDWGLRVVEALVSKYPSHSFVLCKNPDELKSSLEQTGRPDAVFCIGWSWIIDRDLAENSWVVGVHPSDLPDYAGGSPIQNQILNGVYQTKNSLFRITPELDQGPILGKVPLSLEGHMADIFVRLTETAIILLSDFIEKFPDKITIIQQVLPEGHKPIKRIKPDASRLTAEHVSTMTTRQLYDFIRCREDPYPNVYIEDDQGKLLIKFVEFEEKKTA